MRDAHAGAGSVQSDASASLTARLDASPGFKLLARALSDALLILDRDGVIVYVGEGAEDVLGVPEAALQGKALRSFIRPADLNGLPDRILEGGGPWEARFEAGDEAAWVSLAAKDPSHLGGPDANGDILEHLEGHVLVFARTIGAERGARDRVDLYRRAMDATNNVLVISDARQRDMPVVFVNEHFLDVTGYRREDVIGENCRFLQNRGDGTRDDDQEGVVAIAKAIEAGEAVHARLRNYRKDGTLFWNDVFITPIRDENGVVTHFVGVQNDVTESVEAERDRNEQRELLEAFYSSSPLLMGVVEVQDDDLLILSANARSEVPYGDADALTGKTLKALGRSEADQAYWIALFNEAIQTRQTVQATTSIPVRPEAGEPVRWYNVTIAPLPGEGSDIALFLLDEVTEQRETLSRQADLTTALEQASDAVVITDASLDADGPHILYVNRAFEETTGYRRDEVIGRNPRFMQGPMSDRQELDRLRRHLEEGRPFRGELVNQAKSGKSYVIEIDVIPIVNDDGEVIRFVSTQRDVTERRRLEAEVLGATSRAQAEIARNLHDGVGQILAGTAYHLHALARDLASESSVYAKQATEAAALIQQAQDQTRTLAHGLFPVAVEGDGLLAELERFAGETASIYGIDCRLEALGPVCISPEGRAADLYRIVQEAVTNAIRHGKPLSVVIRLGVEEGPMGMLVTLAVEDDGSGFADLAQEGNGIGVSTMRYRARRLGGTLEIVTAPDAGTTVRVRFPQNAEVEADAARRAPIA